MHVNKKFDGKIISYSKSFEQVKLLTKKNNSVLNNTADRFHSNFWQRNPNIS